MFTAVSLFVSIAFAASAAVHLVLYFRFKRRRTDFWYGLVALALAATYALYTFEDASRTVYLIEAVVDAIIGLVLVSNLRKLIQFAAGNKDAGHY